MNKGTVSDAERKALNVLEEWNDVTGALDVNGSWYRECQSVVEDAVHIGIQMALYGKVEFDKDGQVKKCISEAEQLLQDTVTGEGREENKNTCDIPGCGKIAPQNDIFCVDHRY